MAQKRKHCEDFDSVSDIVPAESATIHGKVVAVSTIKKGKRSKFFAGKLTGKNPFDSLAFRANSRAG